MLRSCDDDLVLVAIPDGKEPGAPALADHRSGLSMEPAVRHTFLDARLADHVHLLTRLKSLDERGDRQDATPSYLFLEFVPCLLPWSVMMCHDCSLLPGAFYLHHIEPRDPCRPLEDLGKTWPGPSVITRDKFLDIETGFSSHLKNIPVLFLPEV